MATALNNSILQGLRGLLGRQLVLRRDKIGRTIVCAQPRVDPRHKLTDLQKAHHRAFREAARYALAAKDEPAYVRKAAGTPSNSYNVAIADWFHPPEILDVDLGTWTGQPGQVIRIKASDDVLVKEVTVSITDSYGALLEHGSDVQVGDLNWHYTTTTTASGPLKLLVAAQDLPGHVTQLTRLFP